MSDSYRHIVGESEVILFEDDTTRIRLAQEIDPVSTEDLFDCVQEGFRDLNSKALLKQDMTFEELADEMSNPDTVKMLFEDKDQDTGKFSILALKTLHTKPETVEWVNKESLEATFKDQVDAGAFTYSGVIVVQPDARGLGAAGRLVTSSIGHIFERLQAADAEPCLGMDFCEANDSIFPEFVKSQIRHAGLEPNLSSYASQNWYIANLRSGEQGYGTIATSEDRQLAWSRYQELNAGTNLLPGEFLLDESYFSESALDGPNLVVDGVLPLILNKEPMDSGIFNRLPKGSNWLMGFHSLFEASQTDPLMAGKVANWLALTLPVECDLIFSADDSQTEVVKLFVSELDRQFATTSTERVDYQRYVSINNV